MADTGSIETERLTGSEREILALLAGGHTAKSIAQRTGRSLSSVNEHLRRARRKTGVGSSRELARMVQGDRDGAAEKIGNEEIGLPAAIPSAPRRPPLPLRNGAIAMTLLVSTLLAMTLLAQPNPDGTQAVPVDPILESLFPATDSDPRRLAEKLRREVRDPAWASEAEAALKARYAALLASGDVANLSIRCGATICEVAGEFPDARRVPAAMEDIQDGPRNSLSAPLTHAAASFTGRIFATHWTRAA